MRLRISSGRIVSDQTVISLPLQEVQTSKHLKNIFKTKGLKSQNENIQKDKQRKCENANTLDIDFLCRIHPRPTVSDEVFCGEMDKVALKCYSDLGFVLVGECELFEKHFVCMEKKL